MGIRSSHRLDAIPRYEPGLTTAEVLARFGLDRAVKLASNESPFPPLPEVARVISEGVAGLNRYPDGPGGPCAARWPSATASAPTRSCWATAPAS